MADRLTQTKVLDGCGVSAQTSPDGTVQVAAGGILIENIPYSVTADSSVDILGANPADADLPRVDLIQVDDTDTVSVTVGTPTEPDQTGYVTEPDRDYTQVLLAGVYVAAGVTTITADDVFDRRDFALIHTSPYRVSGRWYIPEAAAFASGASFSTTDTLVAMPFFTAKQFDIQALGFRLTSSSANSGCVVRLGVYSDDGAGGLALLVDAGTVAVDSGAGTGSKTASVSTTLTPGWWWLACALQGMTSGVVQFLEFSQNANAAFFGISPVGMSDMNPLTSKEIGAVSQASVTGAFPDTLTSVAYSQQRVPVVGVQAA